MSVRVLRLVLSFSIGGLQPISGDPKDNGVAAMLDDRTFRFVVQHGRHTVVFLHLQGLVANHLWRHLFVMFALRQLVCQNDICCRFPSNVLSIISVSQAMHQTSLSRECINAGSLSLLNGHYGHHLCIVTTKSPSTD